MVMRSKGTVSCKSELNSDEQLREVGHSPDAKAAKRKESMYFSNIFWSFD